MTHLLTGLIVVTLLIVAYLLPRLVWDVLTRPVDTPED